ncbi:MAG: STAS domain-containing protein [Gaiellaceae bacterium]
MGDPAPAAIEFAVAGPLARDDLPGLCARVCALLGQGEAAVAFCDVQGVEADAVTVDALARLQVAARRNRCRIRLRHGSDELLELVAWMGLDDVLPE